MHSALSVLVAVAVLAALAALAAPAAGAVLPPDGPVPRTPRPGRRQRRYDHDDDQHHLAQNRLAPLSPNAARREDAYQDEDQDGDVQDEEILSPHLFAECCGLAADDTCRTACLSALGGAGGATLAKVLNAVQHAGCNLLMHDQQWTCFLAHSSPGPAGATAADDDGILDAGRLHCCGLARSTGCRRACQRAYQHDWHAAASDGPLQDCANRANESALASCLAEVDHPCRPASACSGLDFCASVLQGGADADPSWFRTCNPLADQAARRVAAAWWRDGRLLLGGVAVPLLRGVESCHRGLWTALACLTHAQPCSPRAGSLPLCTQDCLRLLPRCVRWPDVPPGFSAEHLCAQLAGPPPCVAIPAAPDAGQDAVVIPEPATAGQLPEAVAEVDADGVAEVCTLGAASEVTVAVGTAVRVPREGSSSPCYRACLCEAGGALGRCVDLPCLPHASTCALGQATVEHRRTVVQGCLVCTCSSGDVLCTQRPCAAALAAATVSVSSASWGAATPCRCPPHRVPVCGRNGRTYDNACLARCAGLEEALEDGVVDGVLLAGACPQLDPCAAPGGGALCPGKKRCVPARQVCLSPLVQPCPQYKCVAPPPRCDLLDKTPACDVTGRTHASTCALLQAGASLLHRGACLAGAAGPVCGADGYTYPSRGTAEEAMVAVDYAGPCASECVAARCPALPAGCLRGVRPWGACCDKCVGLLHAAVNTKALDKAVLAVAKLAEPWPRVAAAFSLRALLGQLQDQVLAPCAVRGYVTRAEQLVVVLQAVTEDAAAVRACCKEAERLAGLFEQSGARIQASLLLSAVVAVDLVPAPVLLAEPDEAVSPDAAPVGAVLDAPLLLLLVVMATHVTVNVLRAER